MIAIKCTLLALLTCLSFAPAALASDSLVVNGSAEAVPALAGWADFGGWQVGGYEPTGRDAAEAAAVGDHFFLGGRDGGSLVQRVEVAGEAAAIDAGAQVVALAGRFGGVLEQPDTATLRAAALGADGTLLRTLEIGGPTPRDRGGRTVMLSCAADFLLPAGTRSVELTLVASAAPDRVSRAWVDAVSAAYGASAAPAAGRVAKGCIPPFGPTSVPATVAAARPPVPSMAALMAVRRGGSCARGRSLTFRPTAAGRTNLARLTARVVGRRGVTATGAGRIAELRVALPARRSTVKLTATLQDGRVVRMSRTIARCPGR
jgi:hypothetical protein